jgi:hypothetical protein
MASLAGDDARSSTIATAMSNGIRQDRGRRRPAAAFSGGDAIIGASGFTDISAR